MATKSHVLTVPSELQYDHGEVLQGGAQFFRFETLDELKSYWAHEGRGMRYACVGTGFSTPGRFLETHEWVFSPTKEALIDAVVRWDEFKIITRWFDSMSDELLTKHHLQRRRAARRDLRMALGTWSVEDEAAYGANTRRGHALGRHGFWRLDNLPCQLTHFDWFSEHVKLPHDPEIPRAHAELLLKRATFDDWKDQQHLHDVSVLDADGVDEDISYWDRERAEGRESYEN
jgi:hypothetical protein